MAQRNNTIFSALGRNAVHPFPARMAPELVCNLIKSSPRPIRILDPMMGSGTVLAIAQASKHKVFGVDIDPLAVLIARTWTSAVDQTKARRIGEAVLKRAKARFDALLLRDAFPVGSDKETRKFIRYWFDANARKQLAVLSQTIGGVRDAVIRDVLWCAFSRLIIAKSTGASRALDLAHSRPHRYFKVAPVAPFDNFENSLNFVLANCLIQRARSSVPKAVVHRGDARMLPLRANSIDLVVTSPPYLNAIDYIRCSKFSLVWMGHSVRELTTVRKHSIGTEVGRDVSLNPLMSKLMLELNLSSLSSRKSAIVASFVDDMRQAIDEVFRVLAPGGEAVYVIGENTINGVFVRNAKILTRLAQQAGMILKEEISRPLPPNRRYMPPPSAGGKQSFDSRMRNEVVLRFEKPITV